MSAQSKAGGRMKAAVVLAVLVCFGWLSGKAVGQKASAPEPYRLIHTIGSTERVTAKELSKAECEKRKAELKIVAAALGTYNEAAGHGSITCLPDSLFDD